MSNSDLDRLLKISDDPDVRFGYKGKKFMEERLSLISKIELELEQSSITAEMIAKLDKTLRTRAINYKRDGHHEVYENTMSLYRTIFGREM